MLWTGQKFKELAVHVSHFTRLSLGLNVEANNEFFKTMKVYAFMKTGEQQQCIDLIIEVQPIKQTEPIILKFIILISVAYGLNAVCTKMLKT